MNQVIVDRNRHTAIVLKTGRKLIHLVELSDGALRVTKMKKAKFDQRGFTELVGYPVEKAVRIYLAHTAGVLDNAKRALLDLIH